MQGDGKMRAMLSSAAKQVLLMALKINFATYGLLKSLSLSFSKYAESINISVYVNLYSKATKLDRKIL